METDATGQRSARVLAIAAGLGAGVVYVLTLLPGVSFGDWAEMQQVPYLLGIAHPTGYPLAILVGKAWSLLPIGSVAYRANLLAAVETAAAVGVLVLVMHRLGVRPVLAALVALLFAAVPTVWEAATTARVDALHLLFITLLLHRALVWADDRRPRDFLLLALLSGLAISNHLLTITVAPLVALFAVWTGRRELLARPALLAGGVLAGLAGMLPYAYIPIRAAIGPAFAYGDLLTPQGFWYLVSGAMFRGSMGFLSVGGLSKLAQQAPALAELTMTRWGSVTLVVAVAGLAALARHRPSVAVLLVALVLANLFFFVNYYGDLEHFLLLSWVVIALAAAVGTETIVTAVEARLRPASGAARRLPPLAGTGAATVTAVVLALAVAVAFGTGWKGNDRSGDHRGAEATAAIFAALPQGAALYSYWDMLEPLWYAQCVEGQRPDLLILAYGSERSQGCQDIHAPAAEVARTRPTYALLMFDADVQGIASGMDATPVAQVLVSYGRPYPEHERSLYLLTPKP